MNLELTIVIISLCVIFTWFELNFKKSFWIGGGILTILIIIWISTRDSSVVPDTSNYLLVYNSLKNVSLFNSSDVNWGFEIVYDGIDNDIFV